jgi:TetR/AcrR family fatty acid metabolism transcriptional regulator
MALEQERAQARHERILEAALRVFASKGYRDAAVDDIAARSGTSKGGVYFHFPGKQALFLALLDRTAARLRGKIEQAMAAHDEPVAKADAALLAVLRTFARHRALARLFMVEALGAGREFHRRMADIREEFASVIRAHLDDAVARGVIEPVDTEVASRAWFGALYEVITHWVLTGEPKRLEDAYAGLRPLLMRSVGARDPEERNR